MMSNSILFRLSTMLLFGLCSLVFIGPVKDYMSGDVAHILGWINNVAMIWIVLHCGLGLLLFGRLSTVRERGLAFGLLLIFGWILAYTYNVTDNKLVSIGGLVVLAGATSAGLMSYTLSRDGNGLQERIVWAMGITLLALPLAPFLIYLDPDAYGSLFWQKVYGFSNVRVFGYFSGGVLAILSGYFLHRAVGPRATLILGCGLVLSWAMLFWGGSRAALVSVTLALGLSAIILAQFSWRRIAIFIIATLSGIAASVPIYTPTHHFGILSRLSRYKDIVENVSDRTLEGQSVTGEALRAVSSNRIDLWEWVIGHISDAPLLGLGYLPMSWMREEPFSYYHSHNIVLEFAMSFGIPLAIVILAIGLWAWFRAAKAARALDTPVASALFVFVTAMPIYACFSAVLFFPFHLMVFMIALGSLIGWHAHSMSKSNQSREDDTFHPDAAWMLDPAS